MKKIRFLCDLDGIAADFVARAIEIMSAVSGQKIHEKDITDWEVTNCLNEDEHKELSKKLFTEKGFCSSIPTYDGSEKAISYIRKVSDLYFVTAPMIRSRHWMPERMNWTTEKFDVLHSQVNFIADKHIVPGDVFLDDSDVNINLWIEHHPNKKAVIWDRPWNINKPIDPRVIHVTSWSEVIDIVNDSIWNR